MATKLSYGETEQEKKQRLLKEITAPLDIKTTYTHDANGNVIQTQTRKGLLQTTVSTGYSADGNYPLTQTDARGQTVTKAVDSNLGTVQSVTDPKGQTVSYTYDILKRVTKTETAAGGKVYRNEYVYDGNDCLKQVKHNTNGDPDDDVIYRFEYDSLGRTTVVKVGTQSLSETAYNTDGTTDSVTYGNNGQARYGYDAFRRLTDVSFDTEGGVRYHYTYGNNGEVAQVEDKALGTTIRSEYDLANRPMRKTTADANGEVYAAEVRYDQYNNLAEFRERVAGETVYGTSYEYDAENRPIRVTFSGGTEVQYQYDSLGRVSKRITVTGTDRQETAYDYLPGVNGNTTPLVQQITQCGERIIYSYDETGNIVSVEYPDRQPEDDPAELSLHTEDGEPLYPSEASQVITGYAPVYDGSEPAANRAEDADGNPVDFGMTGEQDTVGSIRLTGHEDGRQNNRISYRYDALGQLTRTNNPFDPKAGLRGTTWVYAYDQGGNILSKAAYPFTEEETVTGTAFCTDTYTYGNAGWKDQLTAYNGTPITYDAVGNPLNDGEWTYTWQHGRQLAQMSKGGVTVSFVYNENGLRVQKTVTSTETTPDTGTTVNTETTRYILHGKDIVHLTKGTDELHFFYDARGKAAVVDYNGIPYRYVHNLQGDVIALVDENGDKVVEYTYDAWGKPIGLTGTMAETIGRLQPFRYRGYVWDEETEYYYLNYRYYSTCLCRFTSPDTQISGNYILHPFNQYCYCINNPVVGIDLFGFSVALGYYHDLVKEDFVHSKEGIIIMEMYLYKYGDKNRVGRADLIDTETGEAWEVKPRMAGFERNPVKYTSKALEQLRSYTEGTLTASGMIVLNGKKLKPGRGFGNRDLYDGLTDVDITYWSEGNGIIWYMYGKRCYLAPAPVPEPDKAKSTVYNTQPNYADSLGKVFVFALGVIGMFVLGVPQPAYSY